MKLSFYLAAATLSMAAACTNTNASIPSFTVTFPVTADSDGMMAYLVNRETGDKVDSTLVANGIVQFAGTVSDPFYARILIGDKRGPSFIVEGGDIAISQEGECTSTPLNQDMKAFSDRYMATAQLLDTLSTDSLRQVAIERFNAATDSTMLAHIDDPLGRIIFIDKASECRAIAELNELLQQHPQMSELKSVKDIAANLRAAEATAPGRKFADFSVEHNGQLQRLSDYAGKGRWLLVDFWASWCGPCRRAMPLLKELYEQYHAQGLDVLGVAVWDDPADSERAATQLQLPWPQILNAQKVPTDLYGIYGIPHLMLIAPDGTIAARGIEGDELRQAVAEALTPAVGATNVQQ